jgi:cell wall-associated NlpC family hydrolase
MPTGPLPRRIALAAALLLPTHELLAQSGASSSGGAPVVAGETGTLIAPKMAGGDARTRSFAGFSASVSALRDSLVARARSSIGIRYIFGGTDPARGLDCSALIRHVLSAFDISLPRTANEQAKMGQSIPKDREQMRPGDLLTFGKGKRVTHIGMYVGEGRFIHASTSRQQVIESTLDQKRSSLVQQWKGVRRVVDSQLVLQRYDSVFAMLDSLRASVGESLWDTSAVVRPAGSPPLR